MLSDMNFIKYYYLQLVFSKKKSSLRTQISTENTDFLSFLFSFAYNFKALSHLNRIGLTDAQRTVKFSVRSHAFLVRSSCGECVPCQVISVLSGLIRWQVLDMFKTSNGRHRIEMSGE